MERNRLNDIAEEYHYMHKRVHQKASPFGWAVSFDGQQHMNDGKPCGIIIFASIHFTKMKGEFGYEGLPTKWQVLSLSRLWLHDDLPRNSETCVIAKALKMVQRRWLEIHPPRFPDQPYHILKIISYSDLAQGHQGIVYRASNFREIGDFKQRGGTTTRGTSTGSILRRFIYDLTEPKWGIEDVKNG